MKQTRADRFFEICSFLLTSSSLLFREPAQLYGPLRLLQAFSMVASLQDYVPGVEQDGFLSSIGKEIEEQIVAITTAPTNEERLSLMKTFIDNLSDRMAMEFKKRAAKTA